MIQFIRRSRKGSVAVYEKKKIPFSFRWKINSHIYVGRFILCCVLMLSVMFMIGFIDIVSNSGNNKYLNDEIQFNNKNIQLTEDITVEDSNDNTAINNNDVQSNECQSSELDINSEKCEEPIVVPEIKYNVNVEEQDTDNSVEISNEFDENQDAVTVWNTMKSWGWSNNMCAGIMGNMMHESGGNTFDIKADAHNSNHWGICQWSKRYFPYMWGSNLTQQLEFLHVWVGENRDFESVDAAAYWFWESFERSASYSSIRTTLSQKAYDYFVN